jgi:hypothetical protein
MALSEKLRRSLLILGLTVATVSIIAAMFSSSLEGGDRLWPLSWIGWAPVGFVILLRRPGNGIGRGMMAVGVTMGISFLTLVLAVADLPLTTRVWAELVNLVFGVVPWLTIVWLVLVFPSAGYPGRAERITGRAVLGYGAIAILAFAFSPLPMYETGVASPLAVEAVGPVASVITEGPGFVGVILLMLAALVLLFRRWRRSTGLERAQFRWLLFGVTLYVGIQVIAQFIPEDSPALYLWLPSGLAIPATIGVAVLRYRLFEIDKIISRSLTYAVTAGLLTAVFFGVVAALAGVLPSDDPLVVALATLAAAALFNPLRRRVQGLIDRRFNRSQYDAREIIDLFAESLRDRVDASGLVDGWVGVVSQTMQPYSVGVWIRSGEGR